MKNKIFIGLSMITLLSLGSCDDDLGEINSNPNNPEVVPTNMLFSDATRYLMDNTRDGWFSARLTLPWMQYSAQLNYTEEDSYQYRETQISNGWAAMYRTAQNFKSVIEFCENPETQIQMETYGNLDNQIAASRIMLAYLFDQLTSHFGDVPYWSYGNQDPDFQALQIDLYMQPKYASHQKIYADLLKELKEASEQLNTSEIVFNEGDHIYGGDAEKWKKFANSLRLRIANRIKTVYPEANAHITDAIASGVFTSNDDNAIQTFYNSSLEASPFWQSFYVDSRVDFAANSEFVKLLKGQHGAFGLDPRLYQMIAPKGAIPGNGTGPGQQLFKDYDVDDYNHPDSLSLYVGMPYGLPDNRLGSNNILGSSSFASRNVINPTFGEVYMEYAEVEFILSELNGWNQTNYENGVRASMEKWGVPQSDISTYISSLPSANMENVITQKYIALYMQPQEAWYEYRRTGYPDTDILLLPGESGTELDGTSYIFTPLQSGNVVATDIPSRVRYPITEATTNIGSLGEAVQNMGGRDEIDVKLFWDVN